VGVRVGVCRVCVCICVCVCVCVSRHVHVCWVGVAYRVITIVTTRTHKNTHQKHIHTKKNTHSTKKNRVITMVTTVLGIPGITIANAMMMRWACVCVCVCVCNNEQVCLRVCLCVCM